MRFEPLLLDIELRDMFRLFLLGFILIGLLPFFQKVSARVEKTLRNWRRSRTPAGTPGLAEVEAALDQLPAIDQLNGYEHLVFNKLAMAGERGLTFKSLARELHLDAAHIGMTLQSLGRRGLVGLAPSLLPGRRFALSRRGYDHAVACGVLLPLHKNGS